LHVNAKTQQHTITPAGLQQFNTPSLFGQQSLPLSLILSCNHSSLQNNSTNTSPVAGGSRCRTVSLGKPSSWGDVVPIHTPPLSLTHRPNSSIHDTYKYTSVHYAASNSNCCPLNEPSSSEILVCNGERIAQEVVMEIYSLRSKSTCACTPKALSAAGRSVVVANMFAVSAKSVRDIWERKVAEHWTSGMSNRRVACAHSLS
jgi:hypothetical protein